MWSFFLLPRTALDKLKVNFLDEDDELISRIHDSMASSPKSSSTPPSPPTMPSATADTNTRGAPSPAQPASEPLREPGHAPLMQIETPSARAYRSE